MQATGKGRFDWRRRNAGRLEKMSAIALVFGLVALIAAGCGGGSSNEATATPPPGTPSESQTFDFGHPGDPTKADRTIEVSALDTLRFNPPSLEVKEGETVTFRVHNEGKIRHEFVLGTKDEQEEHEREMEQMATQSPGMQMMDEANAIAIPPGDTKELTWTFTKAEELEYGCHETGHYAAGMKGNLTVQGS